MGADATADGADCDVAVMVFARVGLTAAGRTADPRCMVNDPKPLPRRPMRPKRTAPSRPAMKRPRVESTEARDRSTAPRSDFGNGVLAEAQAEAVHGDFMWSAVRGKIVLVISAVGYAVYQLFTSN